MSKADWNEEQLKDLLKQMPKISDNRDPKEFYQLISEKIVTKKKGFGWFVPSFASLAAIILIIILVPNLLNVNENVKNDSIKESNLAQENVEENVQFKMVEEENNQSEMFDVALKAETPKTAVYKEDLSGKEVLTFGIPDKNAMNVVPVSVLVNKDAQKSWFNLYQETAQKITEESLGLSEYYPLNGKITFNTAQKVLNIDLPINHQYGWGSASEMNFERAIITSFRGRDDINKITFTTANTPGITLGNNELQEIDLLSAKNERKPYLLLYLDNRHQPFFVPTHESVNSLEDALTVMKKGLPTYGLTASLPETLQIEKVLTSNGNVTINLSDDTEIPQTPEVNYALEAILLSAKEFGFSTVEFKHNKTENIGAFHFNQLVEVPIAANKVELNH